MKKHHSPATTLKISAAVKSATIAAHTAGKKTEAADKFALLAKVRFKTAKKAHKLARKAAKGAVKEAKAAHERLEAALAVANKASKAGKTKKKKSSTRKAPAKSAKLSLQPKAHVPTPKHRAMEIPLPPIPSDFVPPGTTPNPAESSVNL